MRHRGHGTGFFTTDCIIFFLASLPIMQKNSGIGTLGSVQFVRSAYIDNLLKLTIFSEFETLLAQYSNERSSCELTYGFLHAAAYNIISVRLNARITYSEA